MSDYESCEEEAKRYMEEVKHERAVRQQKLWFIRNAIKDLVAEQIKVKAVLRKPHVGEIGDHQRTSMVNRIMISSLHDLHHEVTETGSHHGSKNKEDYWYKKVREGLFK